MADDPVKLEPCPFCNGIGEIEYCGYDAETSHQHIERIDCWAGACTECGIRGPSSTASEDEAAHLWNRRPSSDALLKALRAMLTVFDTPDNSGLPGAEQETCALARAALSEHGGGNGG